jgi:hypothetical protein
MDTWRRFEWTNRKIHEVWLGIHVDCQNPSKLRLTRPMFLFVPMLFQVRQVILHVSSVVHTPMLRDSMKAH